MRNGALSSARLLHAGEQKSDFSAFVDFQQSIHDVHAAAFAAVSRESNLRLNEINLYGCNTPASFALSRHVFPHCGYVFPLRTTFGLFLQY